MTDPPTLPVKNLKPYKVLETGSFGERKKQKLLVTQKQAALLLVKNQDPLGQGDYCCAFCSSLQNSTGQGGFTCSHFAGGGV